jgi:hypothetical protein
MEWSRLGSGWQPQRRECSLFRVMLVLRNTDLDRQLKHPFWTAEACRIRIVVHWQVSPTSAAG